MNRVLKYCLGMLCALSVCAPSAHASAQATDTVGAAAVTAAQRPRFIEVRPYMGLGFSSVIQNYGKAIPDLADSQMTPGMMVRAGIDVAFFVNNTVALGTGLSVSDRNLRYAMSIVTANPEAINSLYSRCNFYEVRVPVYVSTRINVTGRLVFNVDAGIYLSQGIDGSTRISGYTTGQNSLGQPVISHAYYNQKYFEDPAPIINGVRPFDWGLHLSAGFILNRHYSLNFNFEGSARNLAVPNALDIKYYNIGFTFELGYRF